MLLRFVHLRKDRLTAAVGQPAFWTLGKSGGQGSLEKGKGLIVLGKTKSEEVGPVIRLAAESEGGTHVPRFVEPRTPAKGVRTGRNRTLFLTAIVALLVLRTRPLPHVAQHVKEAKGVGFEAPHWSRLLAIPTTATAIAVGAVVTNGLAPVAGCLSPGTCRVFPLRLRWKTKPLSGEVVELFDELLNAIPTHLLHRFRSVGGCIYELNPRLVSGRGYTGSAMNTGILRLVFD